MTEKRFTYIAFDGFEDNGEYITPYQIVKILNELHEENEQMKENGLKVLNFYENKLKNVNHEDFESVREELWMVKEVLYEIGVLNNERFTLKGLIEGVPNICDNDEIIEQEEVVILLNRLHEENEHLQQRNKRLEEKIQRERNSFRKTQDRWSKEAETKIKELSEENEKLQKDKELFAQSICDLSNLLYDNKIEHELPKDINDFITVWGVRIE